MFVVYQPTTKPPKRSNSNVVQFDTHTCMSTNAENLTTITHQITTQLSQHAQTFPVRDPSATPHGNRAGFPAGARRLLSQMGHGRDETGYPVREPPVPSAARHTVPVRVHSKLIAGGAVAQALC